MRREVSVSRGHRCSEAPAQSSVRQVSWRASHCLWMRGCATHPSELAASYGEGIRLRVRRYFFLCLGTVVVVVEVVVVVDVVVDVVVVEFVVVVVAVVVEVLLLEVMIAATADRTSGSVA